MTSTGRASYREERGRGRSRGLVLLLAAGLGAVCFVFGLRLAAPAVTEVQAQAPLAPAPALNTSELDSLMAEMRELLRSQATLAAPSPRRAVEDPKADKSAVLEAQITALTERVTELESLSRMLLARRPGLASNISPVPVGVPVRDYMKTLEGMGSDVCTKTHKLWSTLQVQQAYGQPDKIEQRADYVEWIYSFPGTDSQLDFHFVNDLCVLAH